MRASCGPAQLTHTKLTLSPYWTLHLSICTAQGQHPPQPVYKCSTIGVPRGTSSRSFASLIVTFASGNAVTIFKLSTGARVRNAILLLSLPASFTSIYTHKPTLKTQYTNTIPQAPSNTHTQSPSHTFVWTSEYVQPHTHTERGFLSLPLSLCDGRRSPEQSDLDLSLSF